MSDKTQNVEPAENIVEKETLNIQPVESSFNLETSQERTRARSSKSSSFCLRGYYL